MALAARHAYRRDVHYLVRDGKIEIIDEVTGRAAPGRVWSRGLHGLVELKEGCRASPATETLAQITFQRFSPATTASAA
jgi:preprotein translocase subunit SecA